MDDNIVKSVSDGKKHALSTVKNVVKKHPGKIGVGAIGAGLALAHSAGNDLDNPDHNKHIVAAKRLAAKAGLVGGAIGSTVGAIRRYRDRRNKKKEEENITNQKEEQPHGNQ